MKAANHALGVDGIVINPSGLQVDPETLLEVCNAYRDAYGRKVQPRLGGQSALRRFVGSSTHDGRSVPTILGAGQGIGRRPLMRLRPPYDHYA